MLPVSCVYAEDNSALRECRVIGFKRLIQLAYTPNHEQTYVYISYYILFAYVHVAYIGYSSLFYALLLMYRPYVAFRYYEVDNFVSV